MKHDELINKIDPTMDQCIVCDKWLNIEDMYSFYNNYGGSYGTVYMCTQDCSITWNMESGKYTNKLRKKLGIK